jgi:hypothetical protein
MQHETEDHPWWCDRVRCGRERHFDGAPDAHVGAPAAWDCELEKAQATVQPVRLDAVTPAVRLRLDSFAFDRASAEVLLTPAEAQVLTERLHHAVRLASDAAVEPQL